jgi:probable rRNA maturation factor
MPPRAVNFYFEQTESFDFYDTETAKWLEEVALIEKKRSEEVNYILCTDSYLIKINREFLKHDTFTDVITFNMSPLNDIVKGEIYISIERINENSEIFNVKFINELHRVMVHGMLHLIGYEDDTVENREKMTQLEDYYLSLRRFV